MPRTLAIVLLLPCVASAQETQVSAQPIEAATPVAEGAGDGAVSSNDDPAAPSAEAPLTDEELMRQFYKGDLGSSGAPELGMVGNAVFVGVGYYNLGGILGEHYARIEPSVDLRFDVMDEKELKLTFAAPFNVLMYDASTDGETKSRGSFRQEDYDEVGDFLKAIRRVELGRKEERLYVSVGQLYGVSVGHGTVIRRYNANLDPDRSRIGLAFDAYGDFGGFETFVSDLAFQSRVVSGLGFVKPLFFLDNIAARSFSIGAHYTADLNAPEGWVADSGKVKVDDAGYPEVETTTLGIYGVDLEVKPVRLGNAFDLKIYGDFSQIDGAGQGVTGGLLLRSNLGSRPLLNAFRVRVEARHHDNNYIPHYFDSLYEVSRIQALPGSGLNLTKQQLVMAADSGPKLSSFYGEATYALVDKLVVGAGIERTNADTPYYSVLLHVEVPALEILRLYASYEKVGFAELGDTFALADNERSFEPNVALAGQARLMLLPFLFLNATVRQSYEFDEVRGYLPQLDFLAEVQIGWEFGA